MPLVVSGLTKAYGTRQVLRNVDLSVADGGIHALLGPNGSGKSTLIGCLGGAITADAGSIELDGQPLRIADPRASIEAGIAVIYQHFSLVDQLSVSDNIFLGRELRLRGGVDRARQRRIATDLLEPFGRPIRPDTRVADLRVGDRQLVEIAKALHRQPRVLILDEPTAALGESEARLLGEHLLRLRTGGLAILYVTHILDEVFRIGDRVTVIRDGSVVLSDAVAAVDQRQVIEAIAPRAADTTTSIGAGALADAGVPALRLEGAVTGPIGPIDLEVRPGEVVGVFGLLGSGRTEIVEAIYGARRMDGGVMQVDGSPYRPRRPDEALSAGVALVAGDRLHQSMFPSLSAQDNLLLPHVTKLSRHWRRDTSAEASAFGRVAGRLGLHPNDPRAIAWAFSGGNQQKIAVGRWLVGTRPIRVLLLDEPTQGIDVGARLDLYALLRDLARGASTAILFTSSDPDETMALADRILVLRRGSIVAHLAGDERDGHAILALAHGAAATPTAAPVHA
ncbi:MAG: sugar ABC transporter ATP-binding protein [Chloroflexi bacterium]|nr:sugar ABC transporter ATP-binding protein [Chloroflexota bacterium]